MDTRWHTGLRTMGERRLTRRATLCGAGVLGIGAVLGTRGGDRVVAQTGTPGAGATVEEYPEVVIVGADYRFEMPTSIPGGWTRLTLKNEGASIHHAMMMRVNDGATLAEVEAALTGPDLGALLAVSTSVGGPEVDPGREASVIADLQPGQYVAVCIIPDADGTPHYMMGMKTPVEVTAPAATGSAPATATRIGLVDFGFGMLPMRLAAGQHLWEVVNDGQQLHELLVNRLAPGVTFEQVWAMLQAEAAAAATPAETIAATAAAATSGPPPFEVIGGAAPMNPGQTVWSALDLEAGEHFAICYIPDPASGAPHFALGMVMPFTVA